MVVKVNNFENNDFTEKDLEATDVPVVITGSEFSTANVTSTDLQGVLSELTTTVNTKMDVSNTVTTIGNQTVSGEKTFADDADFLSNLSVSGTLSGPTIDTITSDIATNTSDIANKVSLTGNESIDGVKTFIGTSTVIEGNLIVNGTTTELNTEELLVEDNIITLNSTASGTPALDAGLEIERGSSTNALFLWDESSDSFSMSISGGNELQFNTATGSIKSTGSVNTVLLGSSSQEFRAGSNDTEQWKISTAGNLEPLSNLTYSIGSSSNTVSTAHIQTVTTTGNFFVNAGTDVILNTTNSSTNISLRINSNETWAINGSGNFVPNGTREIGSTGTNVSTVYSTNIIKSNNGTMTVQSTGGASSVLQLRADATLFGYTGTEIQYTAGSAGGLSSNARLILQSSQNAYLDSNFSSGVSGGQIQIAGSTGILYVRAQTAVDFETAGSLKWSINSAGTINANAAYAINANGGTGTFGSIVTGNTTYSSGSAITSSGDFNLAVPSTSNLFFNGGANIIFNTGQAASNISFRINGGQVWFINNTGALVPNNNFAQDIGVSGFMVKNAYITRITKDDNNVLTIASDGGTNSSIAMQVNGAGRWSLNSNGHWVPALNDTYQVGTAASRASVIYAGTVDGGTATLTINSTLGSINIAPAGGHKWTFTGTGNAGHLLPQATNTVDIGSTSLRVRTVYLVNSPNVSSDERIKENITTLNKNSSLTKILAVNPVIYNFKTSLGYEGDTKSGIIAQELATQFPEAVFQGDTDTTVDTDTVYWGVDYNQITTHLIAAFQEQDSIIQDLKSRIETLEAS